MLLVVVAIAHHQSIRFLSGLLPVESQYRIAKKSKICRSIACNRDAHSQYKDERAYWMLSLAETALIVLHINY